MNSEKVYYKLVRDHIPRIIEDSGKSCTFRTLDEDRYICLLEEKLQEELDEYRESKALEELCDLMEVIRALLTARGYTWEDAEALRISKRQKRGGFEGRILLETVKDREDT